LSGPSEKTIRRLFALSGNACAFPDCPSPIVEAEGTITGEICHVRAQSKGGPRYGASQTEEERHAFDNLILLCRRHHKIVDTEPDIYSVEVLEEMKVVQTTRFGRSEQASDAIFAKLLLNAKRVVEITNNSGNVVVDSPGAIVGGTINLSTSHKAIHVHPAAGTIGADQNASRYIQYLISRYNEFASKEPTRAIKFSYGALSKNIEHKFGAQWKLLPMAAFADLCTYLQARIDKTRFAKLNKSNGHSSYSSFTKYAQVMQSRTER
jgi:hypothetical protein